MVLFPSQSSPPFSGLGFSHFLVTVLVPPPQVTEQTPSSVQRLQPPCTELQVQYITRHYFLKAKYGAICNFEAAEERGQPQ